MEPRLTLVSRDSLAQPCDIGELQIRDLMAIPKERRDIHWLKRMIQWAIQLEFSTIPPYLLARWSIRDQGNSVARRIKEITRQEMAHMGMACNLLNSIGGQPDLCSASAVPTYPRRGLPGGVHPHLYLELRRVSKEAIASIFMTIEEPESGSVRWHLGQTYPTIGAFYTAIEERLLRLNPSDIDMTGARQLSINKPEFNIVVRPITSIPDAIDAIRLIKVQGEGTAGSPEVEPGTGELAHYWTFGEIYYGAELKQISPAHWTYSGNEVHFPNTTDIYPVAPIPSEGYEQSHKFDLVYTSMLHSLQRAWEVGGSEGGRHLVTAFGAMGKLSALAKELMETEIVPGGERFGPSFQLAYE